jgi:hypothetical protein
MFNRGYLVKLPLRKNQIAAEQVNNFGWIGGRDQQTKGELESVTGP